MGAITTIGLDLAKNVFQVHEIYADGKVLIWRQLRRNDLMDSSTGCRLAWLGWRLAEWPIIGRGRSRRWGIR